MAFPHRESQHSELLNLPLHSLRTMALHTFHSNPALGGFGEASRSIPSKENHSLKSDHVAFVQIVKELVDNAVDACRWTADSNPKHTTEKRVRVVIESCLNAGENSQPRDSLNLLRVTVTDNGQGMDDIQQCINPFQSNKAYRFDKKATNASSLVPMAGKGTHAEATTSCGRYGIGLTLSLLHGQRLVPNSSFQITSATSSSFYWRNTVWVVDKEEDTIKCIKQWHIQKFHPSESGTKVSLVLPVRTCE